MTRRPIGLTVPYRNSATSVSPTSPKVLRKWHGLTEEEIIEIKAKCARADDGIYSAVRIAERMLKERNN